MPHKIIGRVQEQGVLRQSLKSSRAEFLAIYGRRRVGKTFLIKNFFENETCVFFYCSGLKDGSRLTQLKEFAKQIGNTFYNGAAIVARTNWMDAFEDLSKAISQQASNKKIVLFFDELPWMATRRSGLLEAIDYYWNRYFSHNSQIKFIVCGSSASWIIEKIINNKGGLYNRVTRTIKLEPYNLNEAKAFLSSLGLKLNHKQVLELYMALGGIPHYLALATKGQSAGQILDGLCFHKGGALVDEFTRLFSSLFEDSRAYINLIRVIANYSYGIGQAQLIKQSGLSDGGHTTEKLKALENTGFILGFVPHGHQERGIYYKVTDEFTLFYLRWIEPNLKHISKQSHNTGYWLSKKKSPQWHSWAGLAFESICYKHLNQIRKVLNIDAGADVGSWRYVAKGREDKGTQIDLLFDRADGVITVIEIKHNEKLFVIDKEYAHKLINKINIYEQKSKTKKQIFLVMITAGGLKPSMYSEELVDAQVVLEDLFMQS